MQDADKRKEMAEEIRHHVKLVTDRQRRNRALRSRRTNLDDYALVSGLLAQSPDSLIPSNSGHDASSKHSLAASVHPSSISAWPSLSNQPGSLHSDTNLDSHLLMAYLDDVFPYHFPFYRPSKTDEGRGWLHSLLLRSKPLYKAALAVAAVYIQKLPSVFVDPEPGRSLLSNMAGRADELYLDALVELQNCVSSLSRKTHEEGLTDGIEVLASIVHLIILEVCILMFSVCKDVG
jgi:hypothetical protein